MKFIAIIVVFNLTNPSERAVLLHKTFENRAQCEQVLRETPTPPKNLRVAGFCVSQDDLLDLKHS